MSRTIRILGGGVSGLTAAVTLAKAGRAVEVYELRKEAGKRFLGDLQGLENWSEKEDVLQNIKQMGLEINFDCDPFRELNVTNGEKLHRSTFERPLFYLVKRGALEGSLDRGLYQQAVAAGVNIHFGETIAEEEADIVATGPNRHQVCAVDSGIVFKTNAPDMAIGMICDEAAVKGYSYLLVTKGYGCICTVLFDQFSRLKECLERTRKLFEKLVPLEIRDPHVVGGVGGYSLTKRFQKGRTLFVGEAAGLQDFLWGFGMRLAITSGWLAASCLLDGRDYAAEAEKMFWSRLRAGVLNRFLWERLVVGGFPVMAHLLMGRVSPFSALRSAYRGNIFHRVFFSFLKGFLRKQYPRVM